MEDNIEEAKEDALQEEPKEELEDNLEETVLENNSEVVEQEVVEPKVEKKYFNAPIFTRLMAAALDFTIVLFVGMIASSLIYRGVASNSAELKKETDFQTQHLSSSHLARKTNEGFLSYTSDLYFEKTATNYKMIDVLSHFYTVYLTNDTSKLSSDEVGSLNWDKEIKIDDEIVVPKDYYSIAWFNENILALPKEGTSDRTNDYFDYQRDESNNPIYTSIGTINAKYIENDAVKAPSEMENFVFEAYKQAVNSFNTQDFIAASAAKFTQTQDFITFLTRMILVLIIFEIVPLLTKNGKTLGKLMMRLSLVNTKGEKIKKWQVLPRGIIYLGIPVLLYLVHNIFVQIGVIATFVVASIVLLSIKTKDRMVIHDFIARTIVVEDPEAPKPARRAVIK